MSAAATAQYNSYAPTPAGESYAPETAAPPAQDRYPPTTSAASVDASYPKTPGEYKRVCDKAMPDLLNRDWRGIDAVATTADAGFRLQITGELIPKFREGCQRCDIGKPIDWRYLGRKKIGSTFRQYMYLCRYTRGVLLWSFRAVKQHGQWSLDNITFASDWRQIFDSLFADSKTETDAACPPLCGEIASLLAHGKSGASDLAKKSLLRRSPANEAAMGAVVDHLLTSAFLGGDLARCELVSAEDVGGVLGRYTYLIQWDRSYTVVHLTVYRPVDDWKLVGCVYEGNAGALFAKVALESRRPATSPQLGRTTKAEAETSCDRGKNTKVA